MCRVLVNAVMNPRVPKSAENLLSGYTTGGPSSSAQLHRVTWDEPDLAKYIKLK
jgi:hypothetical protein